jgi:hypothetical protein
MDQYYEMHSYFLGIYITFRMTSRKYGVKKEDVHFSIPSSRIFLKTVERFLKEKKKDWSHYEHRLEVVPCIFLLVNTHARRWI